MRWNDLSDRSIKTFLILVLLFANIAVALSHRSVDSRPPGSMRESSRDHGIFGAVAGNSSAAPASMASRTRASRGFSSRPQP